MSTELDPLPFARLARLGLPPRVRSLIEGSFQAAMPDIEVALARALDELDRDLVTHTERGSSPHEQNQCFASLREFRQRRNDFLSICRTSIQRSLLMLADADIANESAEAVAGRDGNAGPAVVEASGRDEDLALSQIAARAEIRAAAGLQALAYRFGVIAGSAPIEIDALPLGPNQLCAAIRSAARRFDVFPLHRMALYRRIDKCLFADPTALYDAVNSYLCAYRVYANLKLGPRPTSVAPAPQSTVTVPPQLAEVPSAAVAAPVPLAGPAPQTPLSATGLEASTLVDAAGPVRETALDATFFRVLRERVSARRRATQAVDAGSEGGRQSVDSRELQVALRALQIQPLAPLMVGKWANRSVAHVKQDLMSQLRSSGDGQPRKLRDEDADTIDLIGLVFGQLLEAYRANSLSHAVVSRLQIPVLRVALRDPSFYTGRAHPVWRLLSSFVETLADWVEDEDSDRQLLERLQGIADQLARDYADELLPFEQALDELLRQVGSLQKKAEIAERRHVEAARGRVKLDLARAAAFEVVRQRLAECDAPLAVTSLLDSAWTDAIALCLLRQGVDHPKSRERIEFVDRLLAIYADPSPPAQRHRDLEALRGQLEEGLSAVGFHDEAIVTAWNDLSGLVDATHEKAQQAAARAMSELIRQKPRLGGEAAGAPPDDSWSSTADAGAEQLSHAELDAVERLKRVEVGTWFEFTLNRQGDKARRRLCWFSPVTGRYLFLNARGAKSEDRMLVQLAREIVRGSVHQASAERTDPVERAWRAVFATVAAQTQPPTASSLASH